jgi:tRNA-specific 2-thiouridylase
VTHSQSTNEYYLHSSVDTKNDQSHFLATINQEQLERIILPLADMRREDVLKIGEGMGLKFEADYQQANECFINDKNLGFYIDRTVAKLLIPEGEMINEKESRSITALAEGAHHYYLGESHLRPVPNISIDKDHVVTKKDFLKSQVFIGAKSETLCQSITLERFHFINRMDLTKPCKCFMRITSGAAAIPVMLLFKTNKIILVQLIEPIKLHLNKGMSISFYYKKSAGTKLIGAGVIVSGGEIEIEDRIYTKNDLPQDDDEIARLNAKKLELNFKF